MSLNRKLLDYPQAESKEHLDMLWSLCNVMKLQLHGFYFLYYPVHVEDVETHLIQACCLIYKRVFGLC